MYALMPIDCADHNGGCGAKESCASDPAYVRHCCTLTFLNTPNSVQHSADKVTWVSTSTPASSKSWLKLQAMTGDCFDKPAIYIKYGPLGRQNAYDCLSPEIVTPWGSVRFCFVRPTLKSAESRNRSHM
jgi:hypothetical protein